MPDAVLQPAPGAEHARMRVQPLGEYARFRHRRLHPCSRITRTRERRGSPARPRCVQRSGIERDACSRRVLVQARHLARAGIGTMSSPGAAPRKASCRASVRAPVRVPSPRHERADLGDVVGWKRGFCRAVVSASWTHPGSPPSGTAARAAVGDEADAQVERGVGRIPLHIARPQRDSLCKAAIGCTAAARRIVAAEASDKPRGKHLPASTRRPIAPTVSSIGTVRSTRCW